MRTIHIEIIFLWTSLIWERHSLIIMVWAIYIILLSVGIKLCVGGGRHNFASVPEIKMDLSCGLLTRWRWDGQGIIILKSLWVKIQIFLGGL